MFARGPQLLSGVSGDAEIATDADLATDTDLQHELLDTMTDDTTTDEILPLELKAGGDADEERLILEDSFDEVVGFLPREVDYSSSTFDKDNPFDIASNNAFDETNLWRFDPMPLYEVTSFEGDAGRSDDASTHQIWSDTNDDEMLTNVAQAIHDEIRSMLHSSDGNVFGSEWPLDLVDANGAVGGTRLGPFGPVIPDSDVHDAMTSVPRHDAVDDGTMYTLIDAMSGGVASKAVILDDAVNDLIRSVLNGAYAGGGSDEFMLDDGMDKLMWSKLHNAISGRAASRGVTLGDALDETLTSLLHNAFFGTAASKAVSASTKNACVRGLMVEDYVQVVFDLYSKFQEVCCRNTDDSAFDEEGQDELGLNDVFGEPSLGQFGKLMVDGDEANDVMGPVPNDSDASSAFDEDWLFDLADDDAVNRINLWSFGPTLSEDAADDEMPLVLRDAMSDVVASKAAKGLVWSVIDDAFTAGVESEGLIVDDAVDELMWSKLHDVISVSGRVASGPKNLGDVFDDVLTSLLHNAFFGSTALKAIESLTKYADDRELVVEKYVQAVSERYDEFKQVRYRLSNNQRLSRCCKLQTRLSHGNRRRSVLVQF